MKSKKNWILKEQLVMQKFRNLVVRYLLGWGAPLKLKNKILTSQSGVSLVELMVVVGIMGVIVMGLMTIQNTTSQMQKQNQVVQTAQDLENRIRNLLADQSSWHETLADNPQMACLLNATDCQAFFGVTQTFNIFPTIPVTTPPTTPTPFVVSLPADNGDGSGFTEAGAACNGYANAGSLSCPIAYYITWTPICPSGAGNPCINPAVKINVNMHYQLNAGPPPINTVKYSIVNFVRTPTHLDKSFTLVHKATVNGGTCATGTWTARPMQVDTDPFGLLPTTGGPWTSFLLSTPGTYKCTGTAVGYGVNSFQIQLFNNTASVPITATAAYAPALTTASSTFQGVFSITSPSYFSFNQICPTGPTLPTDLGYDPLGTPQTTFASLVCTLID